MQSRWPRDFGGNSHGIGNRRGDLRTSLKIVVTPLVLLASMLNLNIDNKRMRLVNFHVATQVIAFSAETDIIDDVAKTNKTYAQLHILWCNWLAG